jgi:hypothetical protein
MRTDPQPIEVGMYLALYYNIPEVAPVALANAVNDKLAPRGRGFALLAVGRFGTPADLPVLEKAFADSRLFHKDQYPSEDGKQRPVKSSSPKPPISRATSVEVRVSDTAVAAALRLAGQHPADFGFPLLEMYKQRGPDTLTRYQLLGFFDDEARQAAHKKAREWLAKHRKEKPRQQP